MEIVAKKLIHHTFDEDYLEKNCSPVPLKDDRIEWNDNTIHRYSKDISCNDIAFSIHDTVNGAEFGYFFFTKKAHNDIFVYELTKAVFDSDLPEEFIRAETDYVLTILENDNYLRNDRLFIGGNNLPFYEAHINDTKKLAADLILQEFKSKRDGITSIPQEFADKLKEIADKNAHQ